MYSIWYSAKFKKDIKRANKRGYNINKMEAVIELLASGTSMPAQYKDHALSGDWAGYRECHITPDWLLIYMLEDDKLFLTLTRTGTHSDLFE